MKNLGSMPIWDARPIIWMTIHGPDGRTKRVIENWFDPPLVADERLDVTIVESTETMSFFLLQEIPKTAWVVTYLLAIRTRSGDVWHSGTSVSNKPTEKCA